MRATIREIRDFNREKYGANRESVCINRQSPSLQSPPSSGEQEDHDTIGADAADRLGDQEDLAPSVQAEEAVEEDAVDGTTLRSAEQVEPSGVKQLPQKNHRRGVGGSSLRLTLWVCVGAGEAYLITTSERARYCTDTAAREVNGGTPPMDSETCSCNVSQSINN
eukprot:SAG31_NODE_1261_length_9072_cov_39.512761_2_plen_165_part_00